MAQRVVIVETCDRCGGKGHLRAGCYCVVCPTCNGEGERERRVSLAELAALLAPYREGIDAVRDTEASLYAGGLSREGLLRYVTTLEERVREWEHECGRVAAGAQHD